MLYSIAADYRSISREGRTDIRSVVNSVKKRLKKRSIGFITFIGAFLTVVCGVGRMGCNAEIKTNTELQVNMSENVEEPQAEMWIDYEGGSLWLKLYYGQDGMLRVGRDAYVTAELAAYGTGFEGMLQLLMLNEQENHVAYEEEIVVAADARAAAEIVLPMNLLTGALHLTLTDFDGTTLVERLLYPEIVNLGTYLNVGICLPEGDADYLSSFGNKIEYIAKSNFENDYRALDAYDVILVEEEDMVTLGETASEALSHWVAQGRILIITAAENEEETEKSVLNLGLQENVIVQGLIEQISSHEATRNNVIVQNEEYRNKYGSLAKQTYIGESMLGSVLVNALSDEAVKKGVTVPEWRNTAWWNTLSAEPVILWEERGLPIIQQLEYGEGVVEYLAFSARAAKQEIYPLFYYRLAELLYSHLPSRLATQLQCEQYGMEMDTPVYLLEYFEEKGERIKVLPYVVILMVYLCICLPLLYWWMKRKGMSKYLWGVFPAAAMLFLMIIYGVGRKTRIEQAFCTYLNVLDCTGDVVQGSVYFDVSLPTHQEEELVLKADAQVSFADSVFRNYEVEWDVEPVLPEHILQERNARLTVFEKEGKTYLTLQDVSAFSRTTIWAEYTPEILPKVPVNVQRKENKLVGEIANETEIEIFGGVLYAEGQWAAIGQMHAGEKKQIADLPQQSIEYEESYSEELATWIFGKESKLTRELQVGCCWFIAEELWSRDMDTAWAIVFTAAPEITPLDELAMAQHSAGVTVLILPVDVTSP